MMAFAGAVRTYALAVAAGGANFQTADWLINYSGGFVRRGFFGSLYLGLFPSGQAGLWALFVVQVLLSAVPIGYAMAWLHRCSYHWFGIALVCGPAAITFAGWDPFAFARKESLALAALCLLATASWPGRSSVAARRLVIAALVLFAVGIFSWEGNALMLPGVIFLLIRCAPGCFTSQERGRFILLAAIAAGSGFAASALVPGSSAASAAVCASLRAKQLTALGLCDGAIGYLGWTPAQMMTLVREAFPTYWGYLPWIALSLLPVATTQWCRDHWRLVVTSVLAVAPLFAVATDYGRWTSMLVLELVICLTATLRTPKGSAHWTPLAVALYVTAWGLPHWVAPGAAWPWHGALKEVTELLMGRD